MNPMSPSSLMNCDDAQRLLDAYLDDELDLVTSATVASHLKSCAQCAPMAANRRTMQRLFHAENLYLAPTGGLDALEARLRATINQELRQPHPQQGSPGV